MKYLLDTNICIALLKGDDKVLIKKFQNHDPDNFYLCSIVKAELLYGAHKSQKVNHNLSLLEKFFEQFNSLPFDDSSSSFYGAARALLSKAGTPVGANDLLIASIAQSHHLTLLTRNIRELSCIPGLHCEAW